MPMVRTKANAATVAGVFHRHVISFLNVYGVFAKRKKIANVNNKQEPFPLQFIFFVTYERNFRKLRRIKIVVNVIFTHS
jgi:hypothetical protein